MLSESARNMTAHEASFRVKYANSQPRAIKVIALDRRSAAFIDELSHHEWQNTTFFNSVTFGSEMPSSRGIYDGSLQGWLNDIAGAAKDMIEEINSANIVVIVVSAGENADVATIIGEAAKYKRKPVVGLIMDCEGIGEAALSQTLSGMRPFAKMLVVAKGHDYIEEMLTALGA